MACWLAAHSDKSRWPVPANSRKFADLEHLIHQHLDVAVWRRGSEAIRRQDGIMTPRAVGHALPSIGKVLVDLQGG
jgi:hypothetical protein